MGRPSVPPPERRKHAFSVYFNREEYYTIIRTACRHEATISKYLREAVMEKMRKEKEAPSAL
jgi:hypothetical protein